MRRISLDEITSGMKVSRPIYSSEGRILLAAGIELSETYVRRLQELGIASIFIEDADFAPVADIPEVISEQTRQESMRIVREGFDSLSSNRRINTRAFKKVVDNLVYELLDNRTILINACDIRAYDDYTFGHSLSVGILAMMTGIKLGYNEAKLRDLGVGALLHDIGKTQIDKDIINKPFELTPEEYAQVKNHTDYGFDILRSYEDLSLLSAHVSYQHHERFDGKGYPRGLSKTTIHEYASIVSAADVFDALSADRPYRKAFSVFESADYLRRMSGSAFDAKVVEALTANIAMFPIGSVVRLNTAEIGIVVNIDPKQAAHPTVRVVFDPTGQRLPAQKLLDLRNTDTYVYEVLDQNQVVKLFNANPALV
ncbi:MAG: HD-GYP domain-containing protein [Solirubrobacterales bacterium]